MPSWPALSSALIVRYPSSGLCEDLVFRLRGSAQPVRGVSSGTSCPSQEWHRKRRGGPKGPALELVAQIWLHAACNGILPKWRRRPEMSPSICVEQPMDQGGTTARTVKATLPGTPVRDAIFSKTICLLEGSRGLQRHEPCAWNILELFRAFGFSTGRSGRHARAFWPGRLT